ncbi:MAG TPA: PAS domain-containing protein, partial [Cytophagales bacterium]|nr:PAS domain-containing protein [Cytophagales bacterium]
MREIFMSGAMRVEKFYEQIVLNLPCSLYICNENGQIIYYNKHAEDLWGRAPELEKEQWCGAFKMYSLTGQPI